MKPKFEWSNYIIALLITAGIFATVFALSRYISNQKIESLKSAQDSIALDIMSSETEFSLLSELSCNDVSDATLSQELNSMAEKIDYSETNLDPASTDVINLKQYYTLLEIKDFLLQKQITEKCGKKVTSILYVYTTAANCSECTNQGYVLTALREKYPDLRVYSFDYNVNLSALHALLSVFGVKDTALPTIIVNGTMHSGLQSLSDIEKLIPDVVKAKDTKDQAAAKAALDAETASGKAKTTTAGK